MTVSTTPYYRWASRGDSMQAPFNTCSPNLVQLLDYYRRWFSAVSEGCHNQRTVSGSTTLSTHAWGAACDPRFPNRQITEQAMQWTIDHSAELGVNTIHDYQRQMMWKPNQGWTPGSIGSVGGKWIHVETTPAMFDNNTPIESRLGGIDDMPLTGDDAKLVAAVVWETMLELDGVKAPARVWLTEARKLAAQAAENTVDANGTDAAQWAAWATDWATEAATKCDQILNLLEPPPV